MHFLFRPMLFLLQTTVLVVSAAFIASTSSSCPSASTLSSPTPTPRQQKHAMKAATGSRSSMTDEEQKQEEVLRNFRPVQGIANLYRCANTDNLASFCGTTSSSESKSSSSSSSSSKKSSGSNNNKAVDILLRQAGLVLDLRSDSERDAEKAEAWMKNAACPPYKVQTRDYGCHNNNNQMNTDNSRTVLRLDVLHPGQFMSYLEEHWLSRSQKVQASLYKLVDGQALHRLRMETLNAKGLVGLNEAILETGKSELLVALQAMTVFREQQPSNKHNVMVFHCVQGKDRTGLLALLCQSMAGCSDEEMIQGYQESEQFLLQGNPLPQQQDGSSAAEAAAATATTTAGAPPPAAGKLDRNVFSRTPGWVMKETLAWIRDRYGSIDGYLDAIGFDAAWRERFRKAVVLSQSSRL